MFLLLHRDENSGRNLAGYGWAGAKTTDRVPGGATTFSIRIGAAHQGKGLAKPFCRLIVAGSAALYGARNMWLETWQSNSGAVYVYKTIGFQQVAERPDMRPAADGRTVPDTRLFMSLPDEQLLT